MKIDMIKKRSHIKLIVVAALGVLVLYSAAAFAYKLWPFSSTTSNSDSSSINLSPPTKDQVKAGNDAKQATIDNDSGNNSGDTNSTSNPSSLTNTITASDVQDGVLYIRNEISTVIQDGSCKLVLSKSGQTSIVKTSGTQALAQSSTCKGFNIDTSGTAKGLWNASLMVTSGTETATDTASVTIE
jgi:cytoskeletal protein RodZ